MCESREPGASARRLMDNPGELEANGQSGRSTVRERVAKALDALSDGLHPYVEDALKTIYKDRWFKTVQSSFREGRGQPNADELHMAWDAHAVLTVMWDQWNSVFRHRLGSIHRSLVSELREFRNRWAHQDEFDFDDTYRIFDSCQRLLSAVDAPQAEFMAKEKMELLKYRFGLEVEEAQRRSIEQKRRWRDLVILTLACAATLLAIFLGDFGTRGWMLALFVVAAFGYVISQRFFSSIPISFVAHECRVCGRIIYGEVCPYCVAEGRLKATPKDGA